MAALKALVRAAMRLAQFRDGPQPLCVADSVCVLDDVGNIVFEGKTSSQPDALKRWFAKRCAPC